MGGIIKAVKGRDIILVLYDFMKMKRNKKASREIQGMKKLKVKDRKRRETPQPHTPLFFFLPLSLSYDYLILYCADT